MRPLARPDSGERLPCQGDGCEKNARWAVFVAEKELRCYFACMRHVGLWLRHGHKGAPVTDVHLVPTQFLADDDPAKQRLVDLGEIDELGEGQQPAPVAVIIDSDEERGQRE